MGNRKYQIIQDPTYGYRRLDPVPDEGEIAEFYQSQYYDLISKGGRAPELRRLMKGGEEAERERSWLRSTLHADILAVLEKQSNLSSKRLVDIGCGTGDFIAFMRKHNWEVAGIEPSRDAVDVAKAKGLEVHCSRVEEFRKSSGEVFDAITLINVLEHVPNPVQFLNSTKKLMKNGGIIVIRVPNDFSELQLSAQQHLQKEPWWIAAPDHINYFDFQSLSALLERLGFEVIYSQGDFPMELFLLMGENYVGDTEVGGRCHQKRTRFEMAIPGELRRRIYRALAEVGVGRDCLIFGRCRA